MVLVGHRRAEERHDPVAHDLVDGALVAVDRLHHPLEDGIEKLPCLLGVTIGKELHRALEVGEEHRDLLPLAFQRALDMRIFSARCLGVYVSGVGDRTRDRGAPGNGLAALEAEAGAPGRSAPQAPQASARRAPQPRQNRA